MLYISFGGWFRKINLCISPNSSQSKESWATFCNVESIWRMIYVFTNTLVGTVQVREGWPSIRTGRYGRASTALAYLVTKKKKHMCASRDNFSMCLKGKTSDWIKKNITSVWNLGMDNSWQVLSAQVLSDQLAKLGCLANGSRQGLMYRVLRSLLHRDFELWNQGFSI
jgi:hypothetical protein